MVYGLGYRFGVVGFLGVGIRDCNYALGSAGLAFTVHKGIATVEASCIKLFRFPSGGIVVGLQDFASG